MRGFKAYPWALVLFFVLFMGYPLATVLVKAFLVDGRLTLTFFSLMLTTESLREVLLNSVNLALCVTSLSLLIGYPLAFTLSRFQIPGISILHTSLLLPLVIPPFVGVLGVRQLFSRFGSVNLLLMKIGLIEHPIDWLGSGGVLGIIALQTIHLVPVVYLTACASLKNTRTTLEEAAAMSGASRLRTLLRIVIPLSIPGIFAGSVLVFIGSFTDLGTPLVFEYRGVLSVQIYDMLSDLHENRVGYSFVVFASMLCLGLFLLAKSSFTSGSYSGSGRIVDRTTQRKLPSPLGFVVSTCIAAYLSVTLLPQIAIVLLSLSDDWFMSILPRSVSFNNFIHVIYHPLTAHSLLRSIILSLAAALLTLLIGFLTACRIHRGRRLESSLFELVSIAPLAIPGIVFAFGFIAAFAGTILDNRVNPFPLLIAAYIVRRLPSLVRSASAGFQEATVTLEEAGLMVGASPFRVALQIVFPLMRRHLLAGTMLTFAYSMIEVSDGILLALEERFYPVSKAMYVLMSRPDGLELASALGVIVMVMMAFIFFCAEWLAADRRKALATKVLVAAALLPLFSSIAPAAAQSDELVLVSSHWEGIKREFEDGFRATWKAETGREISLRWLDIGGTSDIVKYVRGQFKATPRGIGIDLVFGGGVDSFLELQRSDVLSKSDLSPEILQAIPTHLSGAPLRDPNGEWFAVALSTFGFVCNKVASSLFRISMPTRWSDLAQPQYRGLLGAADPRKSGSMHAMYEVILQGYGWDRGWEILRSIGANVRVFSGSAMQVAKDLSTAEILCAISIDTHAGDAIRKMGADRLGFIVPEDLRVANGDGIALLKGAPHKRAAERFIEFLLSPVGQRIWYGKRGAVGGPRTFELGKLPVRPDIYGTIDPATITEGSPFMWPNVLNYKPNLAAERWNLVNDLFGAFIIDIHNTLRREVAQGRSLPPIPISEERIKELPSFEPGDGGAAIRSRYVSLWSVEARSQFESGSSISSQLSLLPTLLLSAWFFYLAAARARRNWAKRR